MQLKARLSRALARLRRDERGLALIEFAFTLPLLLLVGLTGIEVANYAIANLRVSQIAMQMADNAARVRVSMDETDVNEVMVGAKTIGANIDFANNGRVVLSDLEPRSAGSPAGPGQWIRWQRCYGAKNVVSTYGVPKTSAGTTISNGTEASSGAPSDQTKSVPTDGSTPTPTTGMGPAGNQVASVNGSALMFAEVFYDYQPIVSNRLLGSQTLHYTAAFNVRQRNDQVIKNVTNLPTSGISACSRLGT